MWQALVLSGDLRNRARAKILLDQQDLIWAGDGGLDHLIDLGLKADYYIGDGDSLSAKGQAYLAQSGIPRETFPVLKDKTDSELALDRMLAQPPRPKTQKNYAYLPGQEGLVLMAALGDRLDHVLGNLDLASRFVRPNFPILLTDGASFIWTFKGPFETQVLWPLDEADQEGGPRNYYSLLAVSDQVKGIYLEGVTWPLHDFTLSRGQSLGISNRRQEGQVPDLYFKEGILRLVLSRE